MVRVTTPPDERDLIARVLRFANLRAVTRTAQVERLFLEAPLVQATAPVFGILQPSEVDIYRGDQKLLCKALAGIASGQLAERRRWAEHASQTLGDTVQVKLHVGEHLGVTYRLAGVMAATWLAVAFLLDEGRGLTNRLGQCRKPGCGKFHLTFEGRRRIFCSEAHRRAWDRTIAADRVRAWRLDRKRERQRHKEK
jgi:hypothetical protein